MTIVDDNKVTMTRGDSGSLTVTIFRNGEVYTPVEGEVVKFYLKHAALNSRGTDFSDAEPLVTKDVPIDTLVVQFDPEDTKHLGFGEYVYDVEITLVGGVVDTFINNEQFILAPEVG